MTDVIRHRGPDDEGIYTDGPCGIGMRRLSIIDLSTGHQPISNEDGSVWAVFNGEIYQYSRAAPGPDRTGTHSAPPAIRKRWSTCTRKKAPRAAIARCLLLHRDARKRPPAARDRFGGSLCITPTPEGSLLRQRAEVPASSRRSADFDQVPALASSLATSLTLQPFRRSASSCRAAGWNVLSTVRYAKDAIGARLPRRTERMH